jgi:hypothetical protein
MKAKSEGSLKIIAACKIPIRKQEVQGCKKETGKAEGKDEEKKYKSICTNK